jgi:hypothetical protein
MLKKYKGFKITKVDSFMDIFIKRKNISLYVDKDNVFKLYSYNDNGYKVSSKDLDFDVALKDIINQLETKIKTIGKYTVLPRAGNLTLESMKENHIYWWEKGYDRLHNSEHYKCETLCAEAFPVECTGMTLLEALEGVIQDVKSAQADTEFQELVDELIIVIEDTKDPKESEYNIALQKSIDIFWEAAEYTINDVIFKAAIDELVNVVKDNKNNKKLQDAVNELVKFFANS